MPSLPMVRGRSGPGLLAHVLVSKYADHLPLYRQSEIYAREGVDLDRSTMADWVGKAAPLMRPLLDALIRHVMTAERLHNDDTPVPVLAPGAGRTKTCRLWVYARDAVPFAGMAPLAVLFRYTPDRRGEHPRAHLAGFRGILQADGCAGFAGLYQNGAVQEAAGWANARSNFHDGHEATKSTLAEEAVERIAALYAIERDIRSTSPAERQRTRATRSEPLMQDTHHWLPPHCAASRARARSQARSATASCAGKRCPPVRDGRACLDNNSAERAIRPVALGERTTCLPGGERAAAIYSLITTAKLNGRDPEAYLRTMPGHYSTPSIDGRTAALEYTPTLTCPTSSRIGPQSPADAYVGPAHPAFKARSHTCRRGTISRVRTEITMGIDTEPKTTSWTGIPASTAS